MKTLFVIVILLLSFAGRLFAREIAADLNGLRITVDDGTGSIIRMEYDGTTLLESGVKDASVIDLAYPIPDFQPLRLASRYSKAPHITVTDDSLVIGWDSLGSSREYFTPEGRVAATVVFRAMDDGRSVSPVMNFKNETRDLDMYIDPEPWIGAAPGYLLKIYDQKLGLIDEKGLEPGEQLVHYPQMKYGEMLIMTIEKEK